jgi:hypothetical protein
MNRKLVANELFAWPEINEDNSKKIVQSLINQLKKYPEIKRKKTPPKHIRQKLKKENEEAKKLTDNTLKHTNETNQNQFVNFLKKHLICGINIVTKHLEKNPKQIQFVLVCRSCKPLIVLTRHLQVMCAQHGIPAGCVHSLSDSLSKLLNLKTVGAFALCSGLDETKQIQEFNEKLVTILSDLNRNLVPLLPPLKNPFTSVIKVTKIEEIEIDQDEIKSFAECDKEMETEITKDVKLLKDFVTNEEEEDQNHNCFGSDFISINKSNKQEVLGFNSDQFILFRDEDDYISKSVSNNDFQSEKNQVLGTRFNQLSMIQQKPNKNRENSSFKKQRQELKNKKMKNLQKNKHKIQSYSNKNAKKQKQSN